MSIKAKEGVAGQPTLEREKLWFPKRRLRSKDKYLAKEIIAQNNNQHCFLCGEDDSLGNLELDHRNGDISDNRLENLRLAHHVCNAKAYWHQVRGASLALSYQGERETKPIDADATAQMHQTVDYSKGSPEMQANDFAEDDYRSWLIAYVKLNKRIEYGEAINSGAELFGVSPTTIYRYTGKITSKKGLLMRLKDKEQKKSYIMARPETLAKWKDEVTRANMELEGSKV